MHVLFDLDGTLGKASSAAISMPSWNLVSKSRQVPVGYPGRITRYTRCGRAVGEIAELIGGEVLFAP